MHGRAVGVRSGGLEQRVRMHVLRCRTAPRVDGGVTCQQTEDTTSYLKVLQDNTMDY